METPKRSLDISRAEHIGYKHGGIEITVLGGVRLDGLDRMRVTLKISAYADRVSPKALAVAQASADKQVAYLSIRHNLDLYNIRDIKQLESKHIKRHYEKLKERSNKRRGGGLSNNALNKHIDAIRKFTEYLRQVGRLALTASPLRREEGSQRLVVLNEEEVHQLYMVTNKPYDTELRAPHNKIEAMRARDRAMLAIYYGCGLRRNEGVNVDVSDIDFDKALLRVRKGKNYKERFVPISKASLKHLQDYVYDHRPELLQDKKSDALLISQRGDRMSGAGLLLRLNVLLSGTENAELKEKEVGLHTLRHSIATHLLQSGMKLESISRFLGHSSLESTQLYTHIAGVEQKPKQRFTNIPHFEKTQLHEDE